MEATLWRRVRIPWTPCSLSILIFSKGISFLGRCRTAFLFFFNWKQYHVANIFLQIKEHNKSFISILGRAECWRPPRGYRFHKWGKWCHPWKNVWYTWLPFPVSLTPFRWQSWMEGYWAVLVNGAGPLIGNKSWPPGDHSIESDAGMHDGRLNGEGLNR